MSTMTEESKALSTQSIDDLMKAFAALTHRIHVGDKDKTSHKKGTPERAEVEAHVADLREQREMIVREIKRRCGE
jgi:hypothetical protein